MSKNIKEISFGFTLLEVMIVVALLGIVLAIAVPSINSTLDEMKLDSAAQEIVTAIHYAQSLAIKEGVAYGVEFFPGTDSFRCYQKATDLTIYNPLDKKPYVVDFAGEGHLQGVGLSTTFGNNEVEFNSLGESSVGGSIILGYAGFQKTINVSAVIGKVSVQ